MLKISPRHIFFLILAGCWFSPFLHAQNQKATEFIEKGNQFLAVKNYAEASDAYRNATQADPDYWEAWYLLGTMEYSQSLQKASMEEWKKVAEYYQKAADLAKQKDLPKVFPVVYGHVLFNSGNYDQSLQILREYQQGPDYEEKYKPLIELLETNSRFARKAILHPIKFDPVNLGPEVNSEGEDYMPMLTADGQTLFFTARNKNCLGSYQTELNGYPEDFFYTSKTKGTWSKPVNLGSPVNTIYSEGAASFSQDGQFVVMAVCDRPEGLGSCDLAVSRLNGTTWEKPELFGAPINTRDWDSQPSLSHDGNTLWFSSTRPGGYGRADIWFCIREGGKWSKPINAGPEINSEGSENSPQIHADGQTLYFSSDGHPGFGDFDLFMTRRTLTGWSQPQNLGYPLNTPATEKNIYIHSDGITGLIALKRPDNFGKSDIYTFELDPGIRPLVSASFVRGSVVSRETEKPVSATVTILDISTQDTIRKVTSNSATGKFLLSLPLKNDYAAFVDAEGYLFYSQHFSLKNADPQENYELELKLEPIREGAILVLNNIFYETGKYTLKPESRSELEHLIAFLRAHPTVTIEISGHTDDVGSESDNRILSQKRAKEVKTFLENQGISADRLTAVGFGESKPLVPNDSPENRAINRRTEMQITRAPGQ